MLSVFLRLACKHKQSLHAGNWVKLSAQFKASTGNFP